MYIRFEPKQSEVEYKKTAGRIGGVPQVTISSHITGGLRGLIKTPIGHKTKETLKQ
jgi:hypothetical protein